MLKTQLLNIYIGVKELIFN